MATLGFGAALTNLLRDTAANDVPNSASISEYDDDAEIVTPAVPRVLDVGRSTRTHGRLSGCRRPTGRRAGCRHSGL